MEQGELIPHLFRTESRKITAVLCRLLGVEHISLAEDIAGETFLAALETWPYRGIPENPTAWLYAVAKNKAKNHIHRSRIFSEKISGELRYQALVSEDIDIDLSEKNIHDSQLEMLFVICHPCISTQSQIGLSLRILCGFGIEEIASALLSSTETINKRLYRAKEKLRSEGMKVEFPPSSEIDKRLDAVLATLYLLFSEGYYSESKDQVLREDLCHEAIRLTRLLTGNEMTNRPTVTALLALMCFHASRFKARQSDPGEMVLYQDQDESLWDQALIAEGAFLLHKAARGEGVSKYHLEASIAYWHTLKTDSTEKWENILQLFNLLLQMEYSPIAALNRTYALSRTAGKAAAITEAEKLKLEANHFYHTLLGELYSGTDNTKAKDHYHKAMTLARTQTDRQTIQRKLSSL